MRLATYDGDISGASHIVQPAAHVSRVIMSATGNQNPDRRAPRVIGIAVRRHILSTSPRFINKSDRLVRFSPDRDGAKLDMRDLYGQATGATDLDCLRERF